MGRLRDRLIEAMETPIMTPCPDCWGDGTVEVEVPRPHSPSRDVGVIDVRKEVCESCSGDGEMPRLCDCGEVVTEYMGEDGEFCMECFEDMFTDYPKFLKKREEKNNDLSE
jgi:hypothetical protein